MRWGTLFASRLLSPLLSLSPSVRPSASSVPLSASFVAIPFRQFVRFFRSTFRFFVDIPFRQAVCFIRSTFRFFCRYPFPSVLPLHHTALSSLLPISLSISSFYSLPFILRVFCRYPFRSVGSHVQLLSDCIHSSAVTFPDLTKSSGGLKLNRWMSSKLLNANSQP